MEVAEVMAPRGSDDQETRTAVVLMVDDDPQLRVMLGYALRQDNFQVEEASSGEVALEMLEQQQPDVILLDVLMPGMGGVETCRRIREQSSIPIIMLTALGRDEDVVAGLEAGADDYCTKPVSLVQLVARIRAQLRRRAMDVATLANGTLSVEEGNMVVDAADRRAIEKGRASDCSSHDVVF